MTSEYEYDPRLDVGRQDLEQTNKFQLMRDIAASHDSRKINSTSFFEPRDYHLFLAAEDYVNMLKYMGLRKIAKIVDDEVTNLKIMKRSYLGEFLSILKTQRLEKAVSYQASGQNNRQGKKISDLFT
jgi:hypothetical protein